jgi:pyrroloquinoline quinone biosynthesis protein B
MLQTRRTRGISRPIAMAVVLLGLCATVARITSSHVLGAPNAAHGADGWKLVVLGIVQDGGLPHIGCQRPPCSDARAGLRAAEKVSCLGLVNRETGAAYLFDATPDMPAQMQALTGGRVPDGIFLTHAHIGHYTGLMYLGKEALAARGVPVYGTRRMGEFLTANGPWSLLVKDGNIDLRALEPDRPLLLPGGVTVTAFTVPHRDEFTDTVGFRIEGPRAKALYVPDADRWEKWPRSIRDLADGVDLAFLDGTFASPREVASRDPATIPHPIMSATRDLLRGTRARVWFIHLNHTNPELLNGKDVAREGMEFGM